ncbi:MAG: chorismate synthase [Acidobacteriota bacterium]|jgi:chorismate synthase|nr:chorismate synthase [Acidobacteriota bacterium]
MAGSTIGTLFRVTTYGESHGCAVGVIVDGATPGVALTEAVVQRELDRRKPGQSSVTTPRAEPDVVHITSGVFEGVTTGTPIHMTLHNRDADPSAYLAIKDKFRPGHADFTYLRKYGVRDWRGSGRASGRETAGRVAAGAVAKAMLARRGVTVTAYTLRAAGIQAKAIDLDAIERNPMRTPDMEAAHEMIARIEAAQRAGDSYGGVVECRIRGLEAGLGEPVFDRLDADLAKAILSIGATKGIEFGDGFAAVDMRGSEHNDSMNASGFASNHAGGILGGISTGAEIVFRVAVKPPSSISVPQATVDVEGRETEIKTEGRHDPCICPRIVPVVEAMAAMVLEDHAKRQAALHA